MEEVSLAPVLLASMQKRLLEHDVLRRASSALITSRLPSARLATGLRERARSVPRDDVAGSERLARVTDPARGLLRPVASRAEQALMRNHRFHLSAHRQAVLAERAREMRGAPTTSEALLWGAIRGYRVGVRFRRQVVLGRYVADFFASELSLVVEVDGGYHSRLHERADERRDRWLRRNGYTVLRLSDALVLRELAHAVALIRAAVAELSR